MHADGLAAAQACRLHGHCIFCEEPLRRKPGARSAPRYMCGGEECWRAYFRAYHRDHPEYRLAETRRANYRSRGETYWHCRCGLVARRSGWGSHKLKCAGAAGAWPEVIIEGREQREPIKAIK